MDKSKRTEPEGTSKKDRQSGIVEEGEHVQEGNAADMLRSFVSGSGAIDPSDPRTVKKIQRLQSIVGNHATQRLLQRQPMRPVKLPPKRRVVQRADDEEAEMDEFLAESSYEMLAQDKELMEAGENLQQDDEEGAEAYREKIENMVRLNAVGTMAAHRQNIKNKEEDMFSSTPGEDRNKPLIDAAYNVAQLQMSRERVQDSYDHVRGMGGAALLEREDISDMLTELGAASNYMVPAAMKESLVKGYGATMRSPNPSTARKFFAIGASRQIAELRQQQLNALDASLSLFYQNYPALSQMDAKKLATGGYGTGSELEQEARAAFQKVVDKINEAIMDIHSGDISPLDLPVPIQNTKENLPDPMAKELDKMVADHKQQKFWLTMGLTVAEIALAFVPVVGWALSAGLGAIALGMQAEDYFDRVMLEKAEADPYGQGALGNKAASVFEGTMLVVGGVLLAVGAGASLLSKLRGAKGVGAADDAMDALEDGASGAKQIPDDITQEMEVPQSLLDEDANIGGTTQEMEVPQNLLDEDANIGGTTQEMEVPQSLLDEDAPTNPYMSVPEDAPMSSLPEDTDVDIVPPGALADPNNPNQSVLPQDSAPMSSLDDAPTNPYMSVPENTDVDITPPGSLVDPDQTKQYTALPQGWETKTEPSIFIPPGIVSDLPENIVEVTTLSADDMLDIFVKSTKRPGPSADSYHVFQSVEAYEATYRNFTQQSGNAPLGFFRQGRLYLPPNATTSTAIHEALHFASKQANARAWLGDFIEEGMTEQLTRQYIQNMGGTIQASEETIYLPNRVLAGELMDVVGDDALTRAYLHGDWTPVSSALTSHFGDTQETLRFLETIRNIGANGKPMHLVDDARQMLLRLGPDDTQPNLMIPNRP